MKDDEKDQAALIERQLANSTNAQPLPLMRTEPDKISQYLFENSLSDLQKLGNIKAETLKLLPASIQYDESWGFAKELTIQIVRNTKGFELVELQARWGYFKFQPITLGRSAQNSPLHDLIPYSGGNYSTVFNYHCNHRNLAAKCFSKSKCDDPENNILKNVIKEVCMLKLASALRVGPKMFDLGCDILEYEGCLEIQMELCSQLKPGPFLSQELKRDLRENLLKLHSLQVIHHDIKFENACFSPAHDRYVLIDFGFSQPVEEEPGFKTITCFKGSLNHCSDEMVELFHNSETKQIDLYFNDSHALRVTIEDFENREFENWLQRDSPVTEESLEITCWLLLSQAKHAIFHSRFELAEELIHRLSLGCLQELIRFLDILPFTTRLQRMHSLLVQRVREFNLHYERKFSNFNLEVDNQDAGATEEEVVKLDLLCSINKENTLQFFNIIHKIDRNSLYTLLLDAQAFSAIPFLDYCSLLSLSIEVTSTKRDLQCLNELSKVAVKKRSLFLEFEESIAIDENEQYGYLKEVSMLMVRQAVKKKLRNQYQSIFYWAISNVVVLGLFTLEELRECYEQVIAVSLPFENKLKIVLRFHTVMAWLPFLKDWDEYITFSHQINRIILQNQSNLLDECTRDQSSIFRQVLQRQQMMGTPRSVSKVDLQVLGRSQLYYEVCMWQSYKRIYSYAFSESAFDDLKEFQGELSYFRSNIAQYYHLILLTYYLRKSQFNSFSNQLEKIKIALRIPLDKPLPFLTLLDEISQLRQMEYLEIGQFVTVVDNIGQNSNPLFNVFLQNELFLIRGRYVRELKNCSIWHQKKIFLMSLRVLTKTIPPRSLGDLEEKCLRLINKTLKQKIIKEQYFQIFKEPLRETNIQVNEFHRLNMITQQLNENVSRLCFLRMLANILLVSILMSKQKYQEALDLGLRLHRIISVRPFQGIDQLSFLEFLFAFVIDPISRGENRFVKDKHRDLYFQHMKLVGNRQQIYFTSIAVFKDLALLLYKYSPRRLGTILSRLAVRLQRFENRYNIERFMQVLLFLRFEGERLMYFKRHNHLILQKLSLNVSPYNLIMIMNIYEANNLAMDRQFFFKAFEAFQFVDRAVKAFAIQKMYLAYLLLNYGSLRERQKMKLNRKILEHNELGWVRIDAEDVIALSFRKKSMARLKLDYNVQKFNAFSQIIARYTNMLQNNNHKWSEHLSCQFNKITIVSAIANDGMKY